MTKGKRSVTIRAIQGRTEPVSGIFMKGTEVLALLVLAHGAGAGMDHPFMNELAERLRDEGVATLRYQFPYWEDGKKRPDTPKIATATVSAAVQWAVEHEPNLPIFAAGKSFGGRMSTTAAAMGLIPDVKGIVCFGFPLHPANKPSITRAEHLKDVAAPLLFLQGTRDALADLPLMTKVARRHELATLHVVAEADHGFDVLKRSGRTPDEVMKELARETRAFCTRV